MLWGTPRSEGALAFLTVWDSGAKCNAGVPHQHRATQQSKEGRACGQVERAGTYSRGSLSTRWSRYCWEPAGLSWDFAGHMLTSWHSLSRASESGSRCRIKESSHQQREATHHWPTWETLGDTSISCRHQGKRSAKHTWARLPGNASSHSTAGSPSCR